VPHPCVSCKGGVFDFIVFEFNVAAISKRMPSQRFRI
jgi:hypothetical protein